MTAVLFLNFPIEKLARAAVCRTLIILIALLTTNIERYSNRVPQQPHWSSLLRVGRSIGRISFQVSPPVRLCRSLGTHLTA